MKEGWEYKKLGECFISINNGANIKQIKGAKGIPVTRIETLSNDKFNRERMGYADILDASPYSSYILNDGDILMSHINSMKFLGRAVQYSKKENETIIHGMNLLRLVPTKDVLSSFLVYQFYTAFFRNQIVSISHQSVNQASFNTTNLKNLKLKVPTLSEQQSIVDYLDAAFAKIDAMKANAEKRLNEAQALFQASLKKMLEPKEGWEEKLLPEISENLDSIRKPVTKGKRTAGIYPYYGASGIVDYVDDYLFDEDLLCISEDGANLLMRTYPIAFPISGKVWVNNHAHVLRFKSIVTQKYVEYCFSGMKLDEYITGAAQPKLTQKALNSIIINLPSTLDEQQSIVATLDSIKSKVDRLQANYEKISLECDALKQAILRQVFE